MQSLGLTSNPSFVTGGLAEDSLGNLIVAAQADDGSLVVGGWTMPGAHRWQNPVLPQDVDGQNGVTPLDVLALIQYLNAAGIGPVPANASGPPYYDVNGDEYVSPIEVLAVIDYLNNQARPRTQERSGMTAVSSNG